MFRALVGQLPSELPVPDIEVLECWVDRIRCRGYVRFASEAAAAEAIAELDLAARNQEKFNDWQKVLHAAWAGPSD